MTEELLKPAGQLERDAIDQGQDLAEGFTNGEIGQSLFITRKTAGVHVSNILRKLGVTNRVEAATVLLAESAARPPGN
jgi:DNA-binding NarL/FixJ family response regulator